MIKRVRDEELMVLKGERCQAELCVNKIDVMPNTSMYVSCHDNQMTHHFALLPIITIILFSITYYQDCKCI